MKTLIPQMQTKPIASIVIPAHNEEAVIGRCLRSLLPSDGQLLDIIVVCNGCNDRTAEIARGFGPQVRVIETNVASKHVALNLGDDAASTFPRVYLDADIVLSFDVVARLVQTLREGRWLAAAPMARFDTQGADWLVRAFYRIWRKHPYFDHGMMGSGIYALSESGRQRFDRFPAITADDGFVRSLFTEQERVTVKDCSFTVTTPRRFGDLLRIKTRSRRGNIELGERFPDAAMKTPGHRGLFVWRLLRSPWMWPSLPVYLWLQWRTRVAARRGRGVGHVAWERDMTSRAAS